MNDWMPKVRLPKGAMPVATLVIVGYLNEKGENEYMVVAKGEVPGTTFLGLTVCAQSEILTW